MPILKMSKTLKLMGTCTLSRRYAPTFSTVFSRNLSDLHFPLLRSWQKPRFLPAETKLMSEKAPQATFSNEQGSRSYAAECRCASRRVRRQMIESKAAWMVSQRLGVFDGSFTVSPYSVDGCDGGADAVAGARQEP
jgi:hypothetical protein